MKRKLYLGGLALAAAGMAAAPIAQATDFEFSGQIRPRYENVDEGALGNGKDASKTFTTMRTRVNVKANVDENTSVFVQAQDVRTWGGEIATTAPPSATQTGTSTSASGLDIHQAYLNLNNVLGSSANLKLGRQEMIYDEHRLIGNIGWIQQAQSFDAARVDFPIGGIDVTAFASQTLSNDSHPTLGSTVNTAGNVESNFYGLRATFALEGTKGDRITPYFYWAEDPTRTGAGPKTTRGFEDIYTFGAYILKHFGDYRVRLDGAVQSGTANATQDISAYMLTGAVGRNFAVANGSNLTLWIDYLSGDDNTPAGVDTTDVETFNTLYATNHAYYGHIDKFLANPTRGLVDYAIKYWVKPTDKLKLVAHGHFFQRAVTAGTEDSDLGQEIDLQAHYPLAKGTKLSLGYSHYFGEGNPAAIPSESGGSTGNTTLDSNWFFAMVNTMF